MTSQLPVDDDCVDTIVDTNVTRAMTRRIRQEALRQLETVDLDDPDSRVESLPLLCRRLPDAFMAELID